MKQHRILIIAGGVSLLLFLLLSPPAWILASIANTMGVQLGSVSGTLWQGKARTINIQGVVLRETEWEIAPLTLLIGKLSMDIRSDLPGGFASGHFSLSAGGTLAVSNLEMATDIEPFSKALNLPTAVGKVSARIDYLEVSDGWFRSLVGTARIGNFVLVPRQGTQSAVTVGMEALFNVEEISEDKTLTGTVKDIDGPFEVDAELFLAPPASYELKGRIAARPGAPQNLSQGLNLLGPASPQGGYEFSLAGSM